MSLHERFAPHIAADRRLPARAARNGPWPPELAPEIRAAAATLGIDALYAHQSQAVRAALEGRHVAQVAGTAAGKSIGYILPILDTLIRRPDTRALLVFPTKALAQDQLEALRRWEAALPGAALRPAAYDGDTPQGARAAIRRSARILITNPDMLHTGILPRHTAWAPFFAGLSDVVIDEMHVYRGVFGGHVANVLRRLRRIARFHGAAPRFGLTSATIANPGELGRTLAGAPVRVIDDDGSPRGARSFTIYNPPIVDPRLNLRRAALLEAEALARYFLERGVQTIVFAHSRQRVELLVRYLNEGGAARGSESRMDTDGTDDRDGAAGVEGMGWAGMDEGAGAGLTGMDGAGSAGSGSVGLVRGYRGGYTREERREIEAMLRDGSLRGVVATNALELGIDIGALGACVIAGYPGSIASTWQQAGRAGRRAGDAAVVLVAGGSPLDQFIARHPGYFFGRSPEHARLDPDNLLILLDHLRCAAFELPFDAEEAARPFGVGGGPSSSDVPESSDLADATSAAAAVDAGGAVDPHAGGASPPAAELLAVLAAQGLLRQVGGIWYWMAEGYPAESVSLRSAGPGAIAVVLHRDDGERGSGGQGNRAHGEGIVQGAARVDVLGTVEPSNAALTVYPGAVYLHDGRTFQVEALDLEARRAVVVPTDGSIYTRASSRTEIRPLRLLAEHAATGARVHHGELEVRTRATGYRRIRLRTHETIGWGEIDLPEQVHVAGGYWFTLDDAALEHLRTIGRWQHDPLADRGPSWRAQADRARARDGHACRMCGAPERPGRVHDVHHIRPFRQFNWIKGENEHYREANALDNLITLCPGCHRIAERALGLHGGLGGAGYALSHLAPLFLMCDARDLGVSAESHAPWTGRPTIAIYERAAGGVGFGAALFGLHARLITAGRALVAECPCPGGCPACVGPAGDNGQDAKAQALAVLGVLDHHP